MPYLGNSPASNFASVTKDTFSGDGSTTAFTLSKAATTNGVAVFVENVRQEPTTAYSVSGTTLTFTAAPVNASGNNIYVLHHNSPASTATHPSGQALTATSGTFSAGVSGTTGTFTSDVSIDGGSFVFNESSADKDFRIESNGDANMLFVDGGNDRVGVGTGTPSVNLHIVEDATEGTPSYAGATHLAVQASASSGDNCNLAITAGSAGTCRIMFGDKDDEDEGKIEYNNDNGIMQLISGSVISAKFSSGRVSLGEDASPNASAMVRIDTNETDEQALTLKGSASSFATELSNIFTFRTGSTDFSFMRMHSNNNNDVEFNFRGNGDALCDGSFSGGGADYAEYFEWKDGNSSNEDRIGCSVILDGNKIVKASDTDDTSKIIGVISGSPVVIGDNDIERWKYKYEKDDYGRYIMEEYSITEWKDSEGKLIQYMTDEIPSDVTVPSDAKVTSTEVDGKTKLKRRKVNPDWDKSKTYIPREDRKEWDVVGLTGKLRLRKGQPTGDRWIKMRDISDTVEEWLVR